MGGGWEIPGLPELTTVSSLFETEREREKKECVCVCERERESR